MDRVKVNVGDKTYNCQIAKTEEDRKKGLMGVENLPPDEGMLFVWEDEDTREMWMKDTKIPLDQIAINDNDEVVLVYKAQPEDETLVPFMNAKYILEVNQDSGIVEGDDFEIDDSEDYDKYVITREELNKKNKLLKYKKVILNLSNIEMDLFRISNTPASGYYVSEKLKNAIEKEKFTGFAFQEIEDMDNRIEVVY